MPGIVSSRIGTVGGSEIVRVEYDPAQTGIPQMVDALKKNSSFYSVIAKDQNEQNRLQQSVRASEISVQPNEPRFEESKYSLRTAHPELYYLDLTESQAIRLNSWSYFGGVMPEVLTSEQKGILPLLKEKLRTSGPPFRPYRQGQELEAYRRQLRDWLRQ